MKRAESRKIPITAPGDSELFVAYKINTVAYILRGGIVKLGLKDEALKDVRCERLSSHC